MIIGMIKAHPTKNRMARRATLTLRWPAKQGGGQESGKRSSAGAAVCADRASRVAVKGGAGQEVGCSHP
jgi:hypothetical protein